VQLHHRRNCFDHETTSAINHHWLPVCFNKFNRTANLNNQKQPALIVNDLKLGENASGGIDLWVDIGTEGFFKDPKVNKE
jgi:hypothetical protein